MRTNLEFFLGKVGWQVLPVSDYIIDKPNGPIWIERKSVRDFLSSIGDGRLFRQVENMVSLAEDCGAKPYVLLEGTWTPVETSKGFMVKPSNDGRKNPSGYYVTSFLGAMSKVQSKGVQIWTSDSKDGTVKLIAALAGYKPTEGK